MFKRKYIYSIISVWTLFMAMVRADHCHIEGTVYGLELHADHQDTIPLYGAELYWLETAQGTTTDEHGRFHLSKPEPGKSYELIVRYVSYENDTLRIQSEQVVTDILLDHLHETENITIEADHAHHMEHLDVAVNTRTLSTAGLRTLACCNLSESFENTAAVDVEYTDAVSGAKRIKMLGLAGYYTQILIEKNPLMSGLISPYALEFVPGAWMQSIDISKGTASVMTGYESITGQINVEIKKPENSEPLILNAYQNSMGKTEGSLMVSKGLSSQLSTLLLFYGTRNKRSSDANKDTFLDMPLLTHYNIMNRWSWQTEHSHMQWGLSAIRDHRDGGQNLIDFDRHTYDSRYYGFHNRTDRVQMFFKAGLSLDHDHSSSVGLTVSGFQHTQDAFWGIKDYSGDQKNIYANLIYQKVLEHHKVSTGFSGLLDRKTEKYLGHPYTANESVPGAFLEYTYTQELRWTAMAGIRYDRHNLYGSLWTPRFHIKYHLSPLMYFRASAGKGYRNPSVFSEHLSILASAKEAVFLEKIRAEEAWNYGIQFYSDFVMSSDHPVSVILDYYRTDFQNQVVVDQEQENSRIYIYNLNGKSYSNSFQAEINATLFRGFDLTAAWRRNHVKTTFTGRLLELPLTSRYKGLLAGSYALPNKKWQFDWTAQFNGRTRLPNTEIYPEAYRKGRYSPAFTVLFGQIKRKMGMWEIYLGVENITDYRQKDPILAWQDPFGPYFNSSMIWGPTIGRRIYVGLRLN